MKKLSAFFVLATAAMATIPTQAQAATTASPFNVTVTFTSACLINTVPLNLNFGTYTAYGAASVPAPTTAVTFKCTQGLPAPAAALDAAGGAVAGLAYTVATGAGTKTTTGTAGTATTAATQDVWSYTVTGGMAAGQPGDITSPATRVRTLTITY